MQVACRGEVNVIDILYLLYIYVFCIWCLCGFENNSVTVAAGVHLN